MSITIDEQIAEEEARLARYDPFGTAAPAVSGELTLLRRIRDLEKENAELRARLEDDEGGKASELTSHTPPHLLPLD